MPRRNTLRVDVADTYYHVYARGHNRAKIFKDQADFFYFLDLFARYLSQEEKRDSTDRPYPHLYNDVELLAYCLMPNHFHFLVYQITEGSLGKLMRSVMTSYSCYFNQKYKVTGSLFESRYRASIITSDEYLMQVSRYIHLNPGNWRAYPYSSIHAYFGVGQEEWLRPQRIIELFGSTPIYADFLDDRKDFEDSITLIKDELAD